ncbi:phosphoglycerate mutase [Sphaerotilus natans subsp. natans DSM 6575]|jgi:probable phosphoglycerate mutase|uniref:Phosphoglycerate mutase n=1 Tax=Sphaerotilus natans subsp. natans DSM 6575 TaxID=1286631 RepID=A0A059KRG3_9BURK|nr:histidine phosphatase family protein [Sphaerotilus natans]KDB54047.1 phosphoglycerate mutase [Sphaerotilus natans subsp. natans DSM 6575]SIQ69682.1 phosphoglycerate mutase [Sphaerotilus natans]
MGHGTRILAIRHGETAWNVDTRIQGQLDIPLNDTGRWQAGRVAEALAGEDIAAIYASDLVRAADTAAAISARVGLPVVHDQGLRERRFGLFQGRTVAEVEAIHPDLVRRWKSREPDFEPEGAESLRVFYQRSVDAAQRLAAAHPGQTVVMVAHGGVLDCLYRAACGMPIEAPRTWQLGNASINRLLFTGERLTMIGWGDIQHLEGDALEESSDGGRSLTPAHSLS